MISNFSRTMKISLTGIMAALVFVITWLVRIPVPLPAVTGAYINVGDAVVFMAGYLLGGAYGAIASALGSALADVIGGATQYALATFIIKGLMAFVFALLIKKKCNVYIYLISAAVCGIIMSAGYFIFEALSFGTVLAIASLPFNLIQMAGSVIISVPAYHAARYIAKIFFKRN